MVVVLGVIPGAVIGRTIRRTLNGGDKKPLPPVRIDRSCPYCGGTAFRFVDAGEPTPHHFVCPECRREFGDIAQMTPEEAANVKRINEDCLPPLSRLRRMGEFCITARPLEAFME